MTNNTQTAAPAIELYKARDGLLLINGVPVTALANRAGRTPFYAYDRALIVARIKALRGVLPPSVDLHYAVKANPMPALVDYVAGLVDGLDVASAGEMEVALQAGMTGSRISFAGPGKTEAEIARAVAAGVTINVESEAQFRHVVRAGSAVGKRPRIAVRVNPDFALKSSGMQMGGGPQQFGVDSEKVPALLKKIVAADVDLAGFHIFSGSQNLNAEAIIETMTRAVDLAIALAVPAGLRLDHVNIGGGLGIPYFPGEKPLNPAPIGKALAGLARKAKSELAGARLVVELGRYIVGEAGVYICRVLEKKISRGETFLITDGGLHHHLAASGNFGQVLRRNYPVAVANRMGAPAGKPVNVVGPLCTPLDILGAKVALPAARAGDLIAVFQSGAYGLTASPTAFLSHAPPAELLV